MTYNTFTSNDNYINTFSPVLDIVTLQEPLVSDNALTVLKERYLAKDDHGVTYESPMQMFLRIASAVAGAETTPEDHVYWTKEFYRLMATNMFMPNSPTIMNAGRRLGMLSACFTLRVEDDLEKIFSTVKDVAMTQRAGGGCGFNFSELRPSGSIVKSSGGITAGPLSFIDVFSQTTNTIQQGAFRRGANMALLSCSHPDLIDFICAKEDLSRWQNYNISVAVTDEFMKTLYDNRDTHHFVSHKEWGQGYLWKNLETKKVVAIREPEQVPSDFVAWTVGDTWDLICKRAWSTGEPGLFFIDKANKDLSIAHLGRIEAVNPCFHPDTLIETIEGQKKIKDITLPIKVYSMDKDHKLCVRQASSAWLSKKDQKTKTITMCNGKHITVTYDHKLYIKNRGWVNAKDVAKGDHIISLCRARRGARYSGIKLSSTPGNKYQMEHRLVAESVYRQLKKLDDVHHIDGDTYNNSADNLAILTHSKHARMTALSQPNNHQVIDKNGQFITSKDSKHGRKCIIPLPDYLKTKHKTTPRVISIKEGPVTDVYDIKVEETSNLIANGLVCHNCGEEPLHYDDNCVLGSINLSKFYDKTEPDNISLESLKYTITVATRFLDNVISINKLPTPAMSEMTLKTRRIGLGIMGFADFLFKAKVAYDSDEGIRYGEIFGKILSETTREASKELAKEKGNFGAWEGSSYSISKEPMRNSIRTTVAPTGTISILASCSGGIEPIFALAFKRTVMPDANMKFIEMYEEHPEWIKALEELKLSSDAKKFLRSYVKEHGYIPSSEDIPNKFEKDIDKILELRYIFCTSHDIHPTKHVKMQAAWQKYIDASISKTINLPKSATKDIVDEVYKLAFKTGCKGVTVYRDGCRDNISGMKQPMTTGSTSIDIPKVKSKKRDVYPSFRTQLKTQFGNLHVHVVIDPDTNKEIEVFAQLGKAGDLIAADLEAICRMTSMSLKNGTSIEEVIDQLEGIGTTHILPSEDGKIVSMPDALSKALKRYLKSINQDRARPLSSKSLTETRYRMKCPVCDIGELVFQEGCQKCHSCAYTAC